MRLKLGVGRGSTVAREVEIAFVRQVVFSLASESLPSEILLRY